MVVMEPEDEINKLQELAYHQNKLIELLGEEISEISGFALSQGWRTSRFDKEVKIRKDIENILKELHE